MPGLLSFDLDGLSVTNTSDGGYFATQDPIHHAVPGAMLDVPSFGTDGLLVLLGGRNTIGSKAPITNPSFNNITIYDKANQNGTLKQQPELFQNPGYFSAQWVFKARIKAPLKCMSTPTTLAFFVLYGTSKCQPNDENIDSSMVGQVITAQTRYTSLAYQPLNGSKSSILPQPLELGIHVILSAIR